jgi:hypothetical protein
VASFVIALLLAAGTLSSQWLGSSGAYSDGIALSMGFSTALYAMTLIYVRQYVVRTDAIQHHAA